MNTLPSADPRGSFATTHWTAVLRSHGDSDQAREELGELCAAYWHPVHAFIRRRVGDDDQARDLTQEFFARVLTGRGVAGADPARGKFRSFLLGAVRHFLSDMADRARAGKRGGGEEMVSLDGIGEEEIVTKDWSGADRGFDREWAVSVVNRALGALESEQTTDARREVHQVLKPWLQGPVDGNSQAVAAARLGWTENAVRVAVHRMRRRFRDLIRSEIAQTVDGEAAVQEELRYLLEVLVGDG